MFDLSISWGADAVAAAGGLLLGGIFFGGLWWTTRRASASPRPAAWIGGSLLLRVAVTLAGFYVLGGVEWDRWLACLLAFVVARAAATRLARPPRLPSPEGIHASQS